MIMAIRVVKAGLQTTLQGGPFSGHRHLGMPAAGAADCLSLALANRLVGNSCTDIAMEITLDEAKFTAEQALTIALVGGAGFLRINGEDRDLHHSVAVDKDDQIHVGPAIKGCRSYLTVRGGVEAQTLLGGGSTYMPAALGGFEGRALENGDCLKINQSGGAEEQRVTPPNLRPAITNQYLIRITKGPEFETLTDQSQNNLSKTQWQVSARSNRMGVMLEGNQLETVDTAHMKSAPVFPGTIQCPPGGHPFLLGPDAQTTGGYPRAAQVIRADRHLIGQLKAGSTVGFVITTPERAAKIYREKLALLEPWLGAVSLW